MNTEIIIAEWRKNSRETLRVRLDSYQGETVICCRAWYAGSNGVMKPGRGGLTVSIRHLPALAIALAKAEETANAAGLFETKEDAT